MARAAVETEDMMAQRRFQLRRVAGKTVVACSQELAVYAEKLGQVADRSGRSDPLASPMRVFQELYEVQQPSQPHGCQPFSNERLLNLAAAMSQTAAVSSRQELYPRGMAAERALRLGIGALSGLGLGETEKGFTVEQIRERVKSRYPDAEPLPDRPELDALLHKVGLDVRWDAETKTLPAPGSGDPRSRRVRRFLAGIPRRRAPVMSKSRPTWPRHGPSRNASSMPTTMAASLCSPFGPAGCVGRRRNSCGGLSWSGFRSTTCSSTPCVKKPRNWKSIGPSSNKPMVPIPPVRIGRTCCI